MPLQITLSDSRRAFQPGDEISGAVSWNLASLKKSPELRLFWFTRGKGTEDAGIVETLRFEPPSADDSRPFRFRLPDSPHSFSGTLISLTWALELVAPPAKDVARVEFVLAPGGKELELTATPDAPARKRLFG
jgi:hypothetical protein